MTLRPDWLPETIGGGELPCLGESGSAWVALCLASGGAFARHLLDHVPVEAGEVVGAGPVDVSRALGDLRDRSPAHSSRRRSRGRALRKSRLALAQARPESAVAPSPSTEAAPSAPGLDAVEPPLPIPEERATATIASGKVLHALLRQIDRTTHDLALLLEDPSLDRKTKPIVHIDPGGYEAANGALYYWTSVRSIADAHHLVEWYTGNAMGSPLSCFVLHGIDQGSLARAINQGEWNVVHPKVLVHFQGVNEPANVRLAPAPAATEDRPAARAATDPGAAPHAPSGAADRGTRVLPPNASRYSGFTCWLPPQMYDVVAS